MLVQIGIVRYRGAGAGTSTSAYPLSADAPVVATGGLAELIAPHSRTITAVDPELTLQGLRLVWQRNGAAMIITKLGATRPMPMSANGRTSIYLTEAAQTTSVCAR